MKHHKFIEVVPRYPLPIPVYSKEDYQTWPVLMMKKNGFSVEIVTSLYPGQKRLEIINGIKVIRFSNSIKLYLYLLSQADSLVYAQGKILPLFVGFFSKRAIYITHATMGKSLPKYLSNPFLRFIYKTALSKFKKVVTISPYETNLLTKLGFNNNLVYVPNAIDCDFFSKPSGGNKFSKKYDLTTKSKKIVFLGNMHQGDKTNIETLFKAFRIVLDQFPASKLIVIGKFPAKIKKSVEFLPVAKSVILTGWLSHLEFIKAFAIADVFVNSSRYEGNPLSVGEAVSAKIPVCLSDLPTLKSIYKNSVLYHSVEDYKELAENIMTFFQGSKLGKAKANKAYDIIKSSSNISNVRSLMLNIFDQVPIIKSFGSGIALIAQKPYED